MCVASMRIPHSCVEESASDIPITRPYRSFCTDPSSLDQDRVSHLYRPDFHLKLHHFERIPRLLCISAGCVRSGDVIEILLPVVRGLRTFSIVIVTNPALFFSAFSIIFDREASNSRGTTRPRVFLFAVHVTFNSGSPLRPMRSPLSPCGTGLRCSASESCTAAYLQE